MSDATDRLRAIAQAATRPEWPAPVDNGGWCVPTIARVFERKDATYIATFDPRLVAAMLDVIEAVERRPRPEGCPCSLCTTLARFREVADE